MLARQFEVRLYHHEKIVEVVGQAAGELAQAFQLLHLRHLSQRLLTLARAGLDSDLQAPRLSLQAQPCVRPPVFRVPH